MQYTVEMKIENGDKKDNITISLDTENEGSVNLTSYGTSMNFQQFITFANVVGELREKFAILDGQKNKDNDTTGNRNSQAEQ